MSDKLPVVSGREVVKALSRLGYVAIRQCGSHIRLEHQTDKRRKNITVPDHRVLGKGLLRKIIRDAEISVVEFNQLMR